MIFPRREDATNNELILTIIEIQGWISRYGSPHTNWHETLNEVTARLEKMEVERKPGHWEWDQRTGEYVCSECGCNPIYERTTPDASEIDKYRYCRWCGAPMEVDG